MLTILKLHAYAYMGWFISGYIPNAISALQGLDNFPRNVLYSLLAYENATWCCIKLNCYADEQNDAYQIFYK